MKTIKALTEAGLLKWDNEKLGKLRSPKSMIKLKEKKKTFRDSGNLQKKYNNLRNIHSRKTTKLL